MQVNLEAKNLIVAGSDTTAITLTYLTWAVLRQPDIRKTLEDEVNALGSDFTEANLEELPFLNAVIEESLRLYGAAPGTMPRQTPPGGATFCGYYIPSNTTVSTQAFTIHRDPSLFEDPDKYDPLRALYIIVVLTKSDSTPHDFSTAESSQQKLLKLSILLGPVLEPV